MTVKVITAPAAALSLEQLRRHCKIDPPTSANDADTDLSAALAAARATCEHHTGTSIGQQTLELALAAFPEAGIPLPRGPVTSITSVTYLDAAGASQVLSSGAYRLNDYVTPQELLPAVGTEWPATFDDVNAVKIRYVAGATTLDGAVAQALRLLAGLYFDNRNAADKGALTEIPYGVQVLLNTVKDWSR